MRPRISWMTGADRFILQFLAGHEQPGFHAPPAVIASNIDYTPAHVRKRLAVLTDAGLTENIDEARGYYTLTERGERYLSGDLTADEADELERAGTEREVNEH